MIGRNKKTMTKDEWIELVNLEYVLTWNYSDDIEKDEKRYFELCRKQRQGDYK